MLKAVTGGIDRKMKGAFDSATVVIITMVSMMLILMTVSIVASLGNNSEGNYAASTDLTVSVEDYKKYYESHMTLAALIADENWRKKAGIYYADQSRNSMEDEIASEAEELLSGQSPVYSLELGDNDPLVLGETNERSTPQAFSEIYIASPKEEQLKIRLGVGHTREVLEETYSTDVTIGAAP